MDERWAWLKGLGESESIRLVGKSGNHFESLQYTEERNKERNEGKLKERKKERKEGRKRGRKTEKERILSNEEKGKIKVSKVLEGGLWL